MLVWGNCSDALFTQLENQHIRAARTIYKIPEKVCTHDVLRTVKWQNLGYIYKRRLASEMFKIVKDPGNHRLSSYFTIRETERKGKQLVVKRITLYNVCAVPWGVLSTVGGAQYRGGIQYCGGYHEYRGDILSTMGCSVAWGGYHDKCGGYLEYRGGIS